MKITINCNDFHQAFADHGRGDQFSGDALDALFAWYEELEESNGEELELDPIAICGEWAEYDSAIEAYRDLVDADDVSEDEALDALQKQTTIIELDDSVLIQNF